MGSKIKNRVLFVFVLVCNLTYGQNNLEDAVYLKNGSIIRGIIIEQVPNQSIKIQTKDRNVFFFKYDEIEKMTKENISQDDLNNNTKVTNFKKKGFINFTEMIYSPGIGNLNYIYSGMKNSEEYSIGLRTINGYQLNEHLSLGIGVGFELSRSIAPLLPITFDARVTFLKGRVSPVFSLNAGYPFSLQNDNYKGLLVINPQIGIKTYISKNVAYLFNVGYKLELIKVNSYSYYNSINSRVNFQFITISTGFSF